MPWALRGQGVPGGWGQHCDTPIPLGVLPCGGDTDSGVGVFLWVGDSLTSELGLAALGAPTLGLFRSRPGSLLWGHAVAWAPTQVQDTSP